MYNFKWFQIGDISVECFNSLMKTTFWKSMSGVAPIAAVNSDGDGPDASVVAMVM